MASVRQALTMQDAMTPVLRTVIRTMQATLMTMRQLDSQAATGLPADAWEDLTDELLSAGQAVREFSADQAQAFGETESGAEKAGKAVNKVTQNVGKTEQSAARATRGFNGWRSAIIVANQALELLNKGIQTLQKGAKIADSFVSATARINLMNDGLQTTADLQDKIYRSAQLTRSSYGDTLDVVYQMSTAAVDIFGDNNEAAIRFAEIMNKALFIGGAEGQQRASVLLQLSQALGRGALMGQEFNIIMSNAPNIMKALADEMGVTIGELKALGSEGEITSDIIVRAMFNAADGIDEAFDNMPDTFEDVMTKFKNSALIAARPLIEMFSGLINSKGFQTFLNGAITGIQNLILWVQLLADWFAQISQTAGFQQMAADIGNFFAFLFDLFQRAIEGIIQITSWVSQNWAVIGPILSSVAIALGIIVGLITIYTTVTKIAAAAQAAMNAIMMANPIILVITLIAALIAAIVILWNTNVEFKIGVMKIWNDMLNFFERVPLFFKGVGNGILTVFGGIKVGVLNLVQGLVNGVISAINWMIQQLNKIPGVAIPTIESVQFGAEAAIAEEAAKQARDDSLAARYADLESRQAARAQANESKYDQMRLDAESKADQAARMNAEAQALAADMEDPGYNTDFEKWISELGGGGGGGIKTQSTGGKLDEVGISDEDLKYLRDAAQVEYVNRYVNMRPQVSVQFGDVRETADANQIIQVLEDAVKGAYDAALDV